MPKMEMQPKLPSHKDEPTGWFISYGMMVGVFGGDAVYLCALLWEVMEGVGLDCGNMEVN